MIEFDREQHTEAPTPVTESAAGALALDLSKYDLGWSDDVQYAFTPEKGINPGVVEQISWWKGEPNWMTAKRMRALRLFDKKPMAEWFAVNMPDIDFQDIYYYLRPAGEQVDKWEELPEEMMRTYEKLGIPEAERQYLAGVTAQYESEVVCYYDDSKEETISLSQIKRVGQAQEQQKTALDDLKKSVDEYIYVLDQVD